MLNTCGEALVGYSAGRPSSRIGLAIWVTAFVLVPLGAIFIIVGIVKALRARREGSTDSGVARG
jgi:hypothetical protein